MIPGPCVIGCPIMWRTGHIFLTVCVFTHWGKLAFKFSCWGFVCFIFALFTPFLATVWFFLCHVPSSLLYSKLFLYSDNIKIEQTKLDTCDFIMINFFISFICAVYKTRCFGNTPNNKKKIIQTEKAYLLEILILTIWNKLTLNNRKCVY